QLLQLDSLRRPKRLTVHANDEKEYNFLVKGGEDLRQDERIEQMFGVMNNLFDADAKCAQSKLHIRTYSVIPMTTAVGMIEWVPETKPLKGIIQEEMGNDAEFFCNLSKSAAKKYIDKLLRLEKQSADRYHDMFKRCPRHVLAGAAARARAAVPDGFLRRHMAAMAPSAEAFLTLRTDYAKSLAMICVSGYVLGIGDRHLDNFLLDLTSGQLIGSTATPASGPST
ncbi:unnamed protein product, partial [Heterosigma akashiwo]